MPLLHCTLRIVLLAVVATTQLQGAEMEVSADASYRLLHHEATSGQQWNATVCNDLRPDCSARADTCVTNYRYMHPHCPKTCGVCHNQTRWVPVDANNARNNVRNRRRPPRWIQIPPTVDAVGARLGVPQILDDDDDESDTTMEDLVKAVYKAQTYLDRVVRKEPHYDKVRNECKAKSPYCAHYATIDACDENFSFMKEHCAPFCEVCHLLHRTARCAMDRNAKHAWYPGDLQRMFERLTTDPDITARFAPHVWARPDDDDDAPTDVLLDAPWVVTLENFINASEAETLIRHGGLLGYERSEKVGEELEDGSHEGVIDKWRTSTNAWCEEDCKEDPVTVGIMERMEYVTGLPASHSEDLQLLRYEPGQFYDVHHDYIDGQEFLVSGPRILTVYMYLNDVEEGGETRFDDLGDSRDLVVTPKLGRVVIWPSVKDEDPFLRDPRTFHEALPVTKGIKFGANAWFHLMSTQEDCFD